MLCLFFNSFKCMIFMWEFVCFILFLFIEWIGKLCFRLFVLVYFNCDGKFLIWFFKLLDFIFLGFIDVN